MVGFALVDASAGGVVARWWMGARSPMVTMFRVVNGMWTLFRRVAAGALIRGVGGPIDDTRCFSHGCGGRGGCNAFDARPAEVFVAFLTKRCPRRHERPERGARGCGIPSRCSSAVDQRCCQVAVVAWALFGSSAARGRLCGCRRCNSQSGFVFGGLFLASGVVLT